MPTRSALRHAGPGNVTIDKCPVPMPGPGEVLIKVAAVALNPIDWKMMYRQALAEPTILGCDFAGVVERNTLRPDDGAFADYLVAQAHILVRLPLNISSEQGSTLPTALFTAGFCLYSHLSFPYPEKSERAQAAQPVLLIYGGGTAIGSMQIQLAKLSGIYVISTSSENSFDFVKQCGADAVFDYRDPLCAQRIIEASGDRQLATVDCISNHASSAICAAVMEPKGGVYIACTRTCPDIENTRVKTLRIVAFTVLGRPFSLDAQGPIFPIVLEDVEFASNFVPRAERLLRENKIQPIQTNMRDGGLAAIAKGLVDLKEGKVSRARLVYSICS
ncbi:TOXD [Fusarium proliferatum]|uniref:TOXD n=1 Tax=Gibberella intermedia TaxID=948311 RepID=A0A365NP17_GIBIN|nr:TOXD [Fusarium proliferatum]